MDENISDVRARLEKLSKEAHRRIIDMYFNQKIENMAEIARQVGYTRERVRQIVEQETDRRKKK